MYSSPSIQVSRSEDRLSTYSSASRAASRENLSANAGPRQSPSPSPTPSRCPSPSQQRPTLSPPAREERVSFSSDASTLTPSNGSGSTSPDPRSMFGGRVTAEPDHDTADPANTIAGAEQRIFLAPAPVSFACDIRYKRREKIEYDKLKGYNAIPPRNAIDSRATTLGLGWESHVHPEGSLYFSYKNFFTNEYLYDDMTLKEIEMTIQVLNKELERDKDIQVENIEVGLCLHTDEENDRLGCYYICNMETEEVFWLTEVTDGFFNDTENIKILGREHLRYAAGAGYWSHVYMFPHGRELRQDALEALRSDLSYLMYDRETSKTSTAPYSADDLHRFQQCINEVQAGTIARPQYMAVISRMSNLLSRERFLRYHGERCAQLDADRSVYVEPHTTRSTWFWFFTWLFFFSPQIYVERLKKVWVDEKVNYQHWRKFITELQEDWTASITPATVVLTTNVGFLAIQSVDQAGTALPDRTTGQIVSYVSTILSIGNIIACLILARQHRPSSHYYAEDAIAYLTGRARTAGGLEKLAIIFSIPTAFFIWALLTFFIAISWVCFHETSTITRIMSAITVAFSAMLLGGIIHNGDWGPPAGVDALSLRMARVSKLVKKAPRRMSKKLRTASLNAIVRMGDFIPKERPTLKVRLPTLLSLRVSRRRSADELPMHHVNLSPPQGNATTVS